MSESNGYVRGYKLKGGEGMQKLVLTLFPSRLLFPEQNFESPQFYLSLPELQTTKPHYEHIRPIIIFGQKLNEHFFLLQKFSMKFSERGKISFAIPSQLSTSSTTLTAVLSFLLIII